MSGEKLLRDIHPAEIALPDGTVVRDVRLFVTSHRLLAYRVAPEGRIVQALDLELQQPGMVRANRGTLQGSLELRLADGSAAWVNQGRGCGCGSPLKALAAPIRW